MPDNKISQLAELTTLVYTDVLPISEGGQTYKITSYNLVSQQIITGILITGQATFRKIVGGTSDNTATGLNAGVLAGASNQANSQRAVICGGASNNVTNGANFGFIGAGSTNTIGGSIADPYCFIGNGLINQANGNYATILNGSSNLSTGISSLILNGADGTSYGNYSTIVNGERGYAFGPNNIICAGSGLNVTGHRNFVGAGLRNIIQNTNNNFLGAGFDNSIKDADSTAIIAGRKNVIDGSDGAASYSIICAGDGNFISGDGPCSILGGTQNVCSGVDSSVVGGKLNLVKGNQSSILGGLSNKVYGNNSFVIGGGNNVSGLSQISIGYNNSLDATTRDGATIFSDSTSGPKLAYSPDSLTINYQSGVIFSGTLPILSTYYRIPNLENGLKDGYIPGTIILSGFNTLLICTGLRGGSGMFGRLNILGI